MPSKKEERQPNYTQMRDWMEGTPTREQIRITKAALRDRLNPVLECNNCKDPQCCRMNVRVYPSEAEDIISGYKALVQRKFQQIVDLADWLENRSRRAALNDTVGGSHAWCVFSRKKDRKCSIYDDAPWHCVVFGLLQGDNSDNCHVDVVAKDRHAGGRGELGSPHEFGFVFLDLFEGRMRRLEERRSLAAAYGENNNMVYLPVAILRSMARREFIVHGSGRWVDALVRISTPVDDDALLKSEILDLDEKVEVRRKEEMHA